MANKRINALFSNLLDDVNNLLSNRDNLIAVTTQEGRDDNVGKLCELMFQLRSTYNDNFTCSGQMRKVALEELVIELMARLVVVYHSH